VVKIRLLEILAMSCQRTGREAESAQHKSDATKTLKFSSLPAALKNKIQGDFEAESDQVRQLSLKLLVNSDPIPCFRYYLDPSFALPLLTSRILSVFRLLSPLSAATNQSDFTESPRNRFRGRLHVRIPIRIAGVRIPVRWGAHPISRTIRIGAYFDFKLDII
jgi:hypothetical protein